MSEKVFQQHVEQFFRMNGWLVYHSYDSRRSAPGFPDLCLVPPEKKPGKAMFAELKIGKNKATGAQMMWLDRLRKGGNRAYLWTPDSWDEIRRVATDRNNNGGDG